MRIKLELWKLVKKEFEDKFVKHPAFYGGLCVLVYYLWEIDIINYKELYLLLDEIKEDLNGERFLFPRKEVEPRREYINNKIAYYEEQERREISDVI